MGLGKTVQTIAFCAALLGKADSKQDLVSQPVRGKKWVPSYHPHVPAELDF